jgi:hypothetical protein
MQTDCYLSGEGLVGHGTGLGTTKGAKLNVTKNRKT